MYPPARFPESKTLSVNKSKMKPVIRLHFAFIFFLLLHLSKQPALPDKEPGRKF